MLKCVELQVEGFFCVHMWRDCVENLLHGYTWSQGMLVFSQWKDVKD